MIMWQLYNRFKKSLFNAKIFRFKLKFFSKCPEIGKNTIFSLKLTESFQNTLIFCAKKSNQEIKQIIPEK